MEARPGKWPSKYAPEKWWFGLDCEHWEDNKWLDMLKEEPTGFADRQNGGCKKKITCVYMPGAT